MKGLIADGIFKSETRVLSPNHRSEQSNTFKILNLPDDIQEVCRGIIGGGAAFCTNIGCNVKHRSIKYFEARSSRVHIIKQPGVCFRAPFIEDADISPTLLSSWLKE